MEPILVKETVLKNVEEEKQKVRLLNLKKVLTPYESNQEYSFFVQYSTGTPMIVNSHPIRAASMIKVFILACLYDYVKEDKISLGTTLVLKAEDKVGGAGSLNGYPDGSVLTLEELAYKMITESDNTATNIIIDYIGIGQINEYIQRCGYMDTKLQRKMMDLQAIDEGRENYTSARDLGRFFTSLAKSEVVSPEQDYAMVRILLDQQDNECMGYILPERKIAHKTGELERAYHDGGIVYTDQAYYILILLADGYENRQITIQAFRNIALSVDQIATYRVEALDS